jgi:amino acid adenylation domain-containing protein
MLSMSEGPGGSILGSLKFNTALFNEDTITRMGEHYVRLITGMVAEPDHPISEISMLNTVERELLVTDWNETSAIYQIERGIHELFETQVLETPEVVAVESDGSTLTYRELNHKANQLAHHLVDKGVVADTVVGLCLSRSVEMLVGLLGILKAGGLYLPLDPVYPSERLEFMMGDADATFLVTQEDLLEVLPGFNGKTICIDRDWGEITGRSGENLDIRVNVENLAYIIYTSGTTGTPKGVQVRHRNLVNHACEMKARYGMGTGERMLEYLSISFDAALEEIFPTLLSGGTIVVAKNPAELVGTSLLDYIASNEINYLHLPVTVWHHTVAEMDRSDLKAPPCLQLVLVGGEQVDLDRLASWCERLEKPVRFLNAYGPTETTITATLYELVCSPGVEIPEERVPIGKPVSNVRTYVLDEHLEPVPVGVPGELYIAGAGVASGYLNRPELNERAFLPETFTGDGLMYRTGDMVRYLADGNLVFFGRVDEQVKLRGYRIELGEIEAALRDTPDIFDAVVIMREDIPGVRQLVAYMISTGKEEVEAGLLVDNLRQRLPVYMIPGSYVWLEELPRLLNGKIDRDKLPKPDLDADAEFVPPRTALEERLAEMWLELLENTYI